MDKGTVVPNIDTKHVDHTVKNIIDFAVSLMLDTMDHTHFLYDLSRSQNILRRLISTGIHDPRIKLMFIMNKAVHNFKCIKCNSNEFNYECPVAVCSKCTEEYIVISKPSLQTCRLCPAYDLGTCEQQHKIELEYNEHKMEDMKNEYSYAIIDSGTTTLHKSPGNLEHYSSESIEREEGIWD